MVKKLVMVVFFLGAVMYMSVPAYSEDNAAKPADVSVVTPMAEDEEILPAEEGAGEGVVTGEVMALDAAAGSISVKGADGAEKVFSVVDGETILWKGIEDIKLSDIKKNDNAEVGYYTDDAGKLIASWVDVIVLDQPAVAGVQTAPGAAESSPVSGEE
ncbi:MAG: hypothetical protein NTV71_03165 [Candidatus Omnitrophica bacterium]|nr:hypothetical protein [Candidatus Omnitrophota bacterium]